MNASRAGARSLVTGVLEGLARDAGGADVALCPPFVFLAEIGQLLAHGPVALGAQNVSDRDNGAFTGEVSVAMLKDFGCRYVIVGHSERRALYAESDALVARKFERARQGGLTPILCVGESLAEREDGTSTEVVARQLDAVVARCGEAALSGAVVAYEPVWAIGTGRTASPEQAEEVHAFIRSRLEQCRAGLGTEVPLLYGGSVKASNAGALFAMPNIDGGLIGGASLDADEFIKICSQAE